MTRPERRRTLQNLSSLWQKAGIKSRMKRAAVALLSVGIFLFPVLGRCQEHRHGTGQLKGLGEVHFATSCAVGVQQDFQRGIAFLHSFWYSAAAETFAKIGEKDPSCGMAFWGLALSYYHPLWQPPDEESLKRGAQAAEKAMHAGAKTERERAYIAAGAEFYRDWKTRSHAERAGAYASAMEEVAKNFPEDKEATIFYALALRAMASPTDKTYSVQKKAGKLLEPLFLEQPNHPGIAHYIIHCYDYPTLAGGALKAAHRYAQIAPDSPHALHMPSHIFTRVGDWDASIASNQASADSAKKNALPNDELHALDYMEYAALQGGRDRLAEEILKRASGVSSPSGYDFAGLYAIASMPARFAVERGDWARAMQLIVPSGIFPGGALAWTEANLHFARALGAARTGNAEVAGAERGRLEALKEVERAQKDAYWANQIDIQIQIVDSWIVWAAKQPGPALLGAKAAADAEDASDKHPVTPGPLVPAREFYADMLFEARRPAEALAEYEAVLALAPNRLAALGGAARSAELTGAREKAKSLYGQLVELTKNADAQRPEIQEARAKLATFD